MRRADLRAGDPVRIEVRGIRIDTTVAGVVRDYSSDRGFIALDRRFWEEHLGPEAPNGIALYLRDGLDPEPVVGRLQAELSEDYALEIRSNQTLREQAELVFDRTFSVAEALQVIGIAVAAIGVLASLMALWLERKRELATLRALGLTPRQLGSLLLFESGLLAGLSWLFALPMGAGLAWILLRVIQERSFGWSLPMSQPTGGWLGNLGLALLAAALATIIPILRSRRLSVATALRSD